MKKATIFVTSIITLLFSTSLTRNGGTRGKINHFFKTSFETLSQKKLKIPEIKTPEKKQLENSKTNFDDSPESPDHSTCTNEPNQNSEIEKNPVSICVSEMSSLTKNMFQSAKLNKLKLRMIGSSTFNGYTG